MPKDRKKEPQSMGERLYEAAGSGRIEEVNELIANGVNVNYAGSGGWTPLIFASLYGE